MIPVCHASEDLHAIEVLLSQIIIFNNWVLCSFILLQLVLSNNYVYIAVFYVTLLCCSLNL